MELIIQLAHPIFKWLHIIAGITWIGLLYFFNWINGHVVATMDKDSKQKVVPELMPRTLYFFRWGAAWTWVTGLILLYVVYWHGSLSMGESVGNLMFDAGTEVTGIAHLMILITFVAVFAYDYLYSSGLIKDVRIMTVVTFVLIAGIIYLMKFYGESSNLSPIQQTGPVEQAVDTTDANPDATDNSKVETTDSQTPENPANESDSTTGENEGE